MPVSGWAMKASSCECQVAHCIRCCFCGVLSAELDTDSMRKTRGVERWAFLAVGNCPFFLHDLQETAWDHTPNISESWCGNCWEGHFTHFLRKFKRHVWSLEVVNSGGFLLLGHWDPVDLVDPITAVKSDHARSRPLIFWRLKLWKKSRSSLAPSRRTCRISEFWWDRIGISYYHEISGFTTVMAIY